MIIGFANSRFDHYHICNMVYFSFSHCLLCNILTEMLRPNFETPVNTPQEMVETNMTLFLYDTYGSKDFYLTDPDPNMRQLAETMIESSVPDEFYNLTIGLLRDGTHAQIAHTEGHADWVIEKYLEEYNNGRGLYRSKYRVPGDYPYIGYMTRKNWFLNEVISVFPL